MLTVAKLKYVCFPTTAGCMAALDAEHYLQEIGAQQDKND